MTRRMKGRRTGKQVDDICGRVRFRVLAPIRYSEVFATMFPGREETPGFCMELEGEGGRYAAAYCVEGDMQALFHEAFHAAEWVLGKRLVGEVGADIVGKVMEEAWKATGRK